MDIHPIQESSRRWMTALILAVVAAGIQTTLLWGYAGADTLPAAIDGILSVGLLCLLAYLAWYVIGLVSILQTDLLIAALALLFWLAGGFAVQYVLEQNMGQVYAPLVRRFLFRYIVWSIGLGSDDVVVSLAVAEYRSGRDIRRGCFERGSPS